MRLPAPASPAHTPTACTSFAEPCQSNTPTHTKAQFKGALHHTRCLTPPHIQTQQQHQHQQVIRWPKSCKGRHEWRVVHAHVLLLCMAPGGSSNQEQAMPLPTDNATHLDLNRQLLLPTMLSQSARLPRAMMIYTVHTTAVQKHHAVKQSMQE